MKSFNLSVKIILIIFLSLIIGIACDNINDFYNITGAGTSINQVATPTFSLTAGTYTSAQSATISTTTSGATIYYTTDGSTPSSTTGTVYSSAIAISTTTTINAIAYASNMTDSSVSSSAYTIGYASIQPNAVTGNILWLKADAGITIATGVSNWADQSGNGNDAFQGTAGNQPAFIASEPTLNNLALLRFSQGSSHWLNLTEFFSLGTITSFIVLKTSTLDGTNDFTLCSFGTTSRWYAPVSDAGGFFSYTVGTGVPTISSATRDTNYNIHVLRHNNPNTEAWMNGTSIGTATDSSTSVTVGLNIGSLGDGTNQFLDGDVAEVIIYNNAISAADRQGVECYLSNKYGITVSQICQ